MKADTIGEETKATTPDATSDETTDLKRNRKETIVRLQNDQRRSFSLWARTLKQPVFEQQI